MVVNSDEDPEFPSTLSESCKDFIRCCMNRDPKQRKNVFGLLKHEFLASVSPANRHYEKKSSTTKKVVQRTEYSAESLSDKDTPDLNQDADSNRKPLKNTNEDDPEYYRKMFNTHRTHNFEDRLKENIAPKIDYKIRLKAPEIVDAKGRSKEINLMDNNDSSHGYESSNSLRKAERDTDVFNTGSGGEREINTCTIKPTTKKRGIKLKKEKTDSEESGHNSLSRNLAINLKNKDFQLRLKTGGTTLTNKKSVSTKKKTTSPVEFSESDFDFEEDDEEHQEMEIHEVNIVIKRTKRFKTGLLKKPLKKNRSEPTEVDLLGTTLPKAEAFEVPKLVIHPSESSPVKDFVTNRQYQIGAELSKELHTYKGDMNREFLDLDISPKVKES